MQQYIAMSYRLGLSGQHTCLSGMTWWQGMGLRRTNIPELYLATAVKLNSRR